MNDSCARPFGAVQVGFPRRIGRLVQGWAWVTVCATFVLLLLGSVVTTFRVGMADPIWPTSPWHLLYVWDVPNPGFLIEHTHRLAGYVVGCLVIVLAVGLPVRDYLAGKWTWLSLLGVAALMGVVIQGLLGGFRVKLHELMGTNLAIIHGCFAQVVFALLVGIAVLAHPRRSLSRGVADWVSRPVRRGSKLTVALLLVQLILGALLRHTPGPIWQRAHLLTAFLVVAASVWVIRSVFFERASGRSLKVAACLLAGLIVVQLVFGVEAWMARFASGVLPELQVPTVAQAAVRTAHVLAGALIMATATSIALLAHVGEARLVNQSSASTARREGAA